MFIFVVQNSTFSVANKQNIVHNKIPNRMKGLSKSKYTLFCQCPKALWLRTYKPDEAIVDPGVEARFEEEAYRHQADLSYLAKRKRYRYLQ